MFRKPAQATLFLLLIGAGTQVFTTIAVYFCFASVAGSSFGLATVLLGICSVFNGTVASRLCKSYNISSWTQVTIIAAWLLPLLQIAVVYAVNEIQPSFMVTIMGESLST